jgi:hypothetical protein
LVLGFGLLLRRSSGGALISPACLRLVRYAMLLRPRGAVAALR